jgi:hypothetical protein
MSIELATSNNDLRKILQAFEGPLSKWRTAGGISRDTNLPIQDVMRIIESHPEQFRKSEISLGGIAVFGLRRPKSHAS